MSRPSLTTLVRRALSGECALPRESALIVAVSGGPDSMALLSVLAELRHAFSLTVIAHGVDHGLRHEAARELDLANAFSESVGVLFERTKLAVAPGGNLQERAREARWSALSKAARRHRASIATAHHADDRAETLLIRLLRGAGKRGLGVLPPRARAPFSKPSSELEPGEVTLVRPLLRARRTDVLAHVSRHHVPFAEDPSNQDRRYLRTRIRTELLPLMTELDPSVVEHLDALADELLTDSAQDHAPGFPDCAPWARFLPRATQLAIARLLRPGGASERVWLPGGLVLSVDPTARKRAP